MKGYKGFEKGMVCRGKQYVENMTFEEPNATICESGMHFCENPLDVLDYYPLLDDNAEPNEFAEVEALDDAKTDDGRKFCTTKLKIGAKLTLTEFVNAAVDFALKKNEGDGSQLAASGNGSQLAASGDGSRLAASGNGSQLAASGNGSQLAASGNGSQLAASGERSRLVASGERSRLAASGYGSQLAASGERSRLAASGYGSRLAASGEHSIVAGIGRDNIAKAALGSWIVLAEWQCPKKNTKSRPTCVRAAQIDGKILKPDTFYKLENGEFVEV